MKVTKFAKWSVGNGAEGYTVELTPEDIGLRSAGEINVSLDQVRILQYLTSYIVYQRMLSDKVMSQAQFDEEMAKFGYERNLVAAYQKSLEDDAKKKSK